MTPSQQKGPHKGNYYCADFLTTLLLVAELLSILAGLPHFIWCLQSVMFRSSAWSALSSVPLTLILMVGLPYIALLAIANIFVLIGKLRMSRGFLYRRTNALALQILFYPLTLLSYFASFDLIGQF